MSSFWDYAKNRFIYDAFFAPTPVDPYEKKLQREAEEKAQREHDEMWAKMSAKEKKEYMKMLSDMADSIDKMPQQSFLALRWWQPIVALIGSIYVHWYTYASDVKPKGEEYLNDDYVMTVSNGPSLKGYWDYMNVFTEGFSIIIFLLLFAFLLGVWITYVEYKTEEFYRGKSEKQIKKEKKEARKQAALGFVVNAVVWFGGLILLLYLTNTYYK
jgi:hypothetical protein